MWKTMTAITLTVATPLTAQEPDHRFYGSILYPMGRPDGQAQSVKWQTTPSRAAVREALPKSVSTGGWTRWNCRVKPDGSLSDCTLSQAWPEDTRYEAAGRNLMRRFRLDPSSAALAQNPQTRVSFPLPFFGEGLAQPDMAGCPMPFCMPVPKAPPTAR